MGVDPENGLISTFPVSLPWRVRPTGGTPFWCAVRCSEAQPADRLAGAASLSGFRARGLARAFRLLS